MASQATAVLLRSSNNAVKNTKVVAFADPGTRENMSPVWNNRERILCSLDALFESYPQIGLSKCLRRQWQFL